MNLDALYSKLLVKTDAKLVLLLANHIGELAPILEAIALAKPPPRA